MAMENSCNFMYRMFPIAMLDYQRVNIYILLILIYIYLLVTIAIGTQQLSSCPPGLGGSASEDDFAFAGLTTIRSTLDKARCKTSFFPW